MTAAEGMVLVLAVILASATTALKDTLPSDAAALMGLLAAVAASAAIMHMGWAR